MEDIQLNQLRVLLTKPEKSLDELRMLSELLMKTPIKESLFKQLSTSSKNEGKIFELCNALRYKFCQKGDVVVHEGDTDGDDVYFIIKGNVGVFKRSVFVTDSNGVPRNSEIKNSQASSPVNKSVQFGGDSIAKGLPAVRKSSNFQRISQRPDLAPSTPTCQFSIKDPFKIMVTLNSTFNKTRKSLNKSKIDDGNKEPIRTQIGMALESKRRESNTTALKRKISLQPSKQVTTQNPVHRQSIFHLERLFNSMFKGDRLLSKIDFTTIYSPTNEEEKQLLAMFNEHYLADDSQVEESKLISLVPKYGKQIAQLKDWSVFGEFSQHLATCRTASIITLTNTELICMSREVYNNLFKDIIKSKKSKLVKFIIDCFKMSHRSQDIAFVVTLIPHIQKIKLRKGDVIAKQCDPLSNIYIVKKGEIRLSKDIRDEPLSAYYSSMTSDKADETLKYLKGRTLQVGLCGANEVLGEEFLFSQNPTHECTMVCASVKATLMVFKNSVFKNLPAAIKDFWRSIHEKKQDFRVTNFNSTILLMLKNRRNLSHILKNDPRASRNSFSKENSCVEAPENSCSFTHLLKISAQYGTLLQEYQKKYLNRSSNIQLREFDLEPPVNDSLRMNISPGSPSGHSSSIKSLKIKLADLRKARRITLDGRDIGPITKAALGTLTTKYSALLLR